MTYEYMAGYVSKLLADQRFADEKEKKELEVKKLEAEQAEIERFEREKNSKIEADFGLKRVTEPTTDNFVEINENPKGMFEKRLKVLRQWMAANNFKEGDILPNRYTHEAMILELKKIEYDLFRISEGSFVRHFWAEQKVCKLTQGNK